MICGLGQAPLLILMEMDEVKNILDDIKEIMKYDENAVTNKNPLGGRYIKNLR